MIENLAKAAGQLSDRRVSAVVLWSLLLTIVLYAAVWGVAVWLLDDIEPTSWGWVCTSNKSSPTLLLSSEYVEGVR